MAFRTKVVDPVTQAGEIAAGAVAGFTTARDDLISASGILASAAENDEALASDLAERAAKSREDSAKHARAAQKIADLFE